MGRIAILAEQHWRKYLPDAYTDIRDPAAFFAELEDEAMRQIIELEDSLAGEPVPGESFLDTVGRLSAVRHAAEASCATWC